MTMIDRPVRRETTVRTQGRNLCLELGKFEMELRQKGKRTKVSVPYEAIWALGWRLYKREQDRLNPPKKARRRR